MHEILIEISGAPKSWLRISDADGIRVAYIHPANHGVELTEQDCIDLINQYHPTAIQLQNQLNRDFVFDIEKLTHPGLIEKLSIDLESLKVKSFPESVTQS